jgi:hypothetical protein
MPQPLLLSVMTECDKVFDPKRVTAWGRAKKIRPIRVKPINCLFNDKSVLAKFLLDTIEGYQALRRDSMVCLGYAGDIWQQSAESLHKSYSPLRLETDGWVIFEPKPEDERLVIEVHLFGCNIGDKGFAIKAKWGEEQPDGSILQYGRSGDIVAQRSDDPEDVWIIKREIFTATYAVL